MKDTEQAEYKYKKPSGRAGKYQIHTFEDTKVSFDDKELIWPERYRPRIVEDLVLPSMVMNAVKEYISSKAIPNILLYSSKGGLGKDSIIQVLYNEIPMTILTINASLHRDIQTIRKDVIQFVSTNSIEGSRKVVYLNEVGGLTKIALDSLKGVIEEYSKSASFVLTTNLMDNISHPLKSRFDFYDLDVIPKDERSEMAKGIFKRMAAILNKEDVKYDVGAIRAILTRYFPVYREILVNTKRAVVNGELTQESLGAVDAENDYLKVIGHINNKEFKDIVVMSETLDTTHFLSWFVKNYFNMTKDVTHLQPIIQSLEDLQVAINNRVPFPNISFCVAMNTLIDEEVEFNLD